MEYQCEYGIQCKVTFNQCEKEYNSPTNLSFEDLIKDLDVIRDARNMSFIEDDNNTNCSQESRDIFDTSDSETCSSTLTPCDKVQLLHDESDIIEPSQPKTLTNCQANESLNSTQDINISQKSNESESLLSDLYTSVVKSSPKTTQLIGWSPLTGYKSVNTPNRIKISLGANQSSNSDLDWSISMQTPFKVVNSINGPSINDSNTSHKVDDSTLIKTPKPVLPNTSDLDKTMSSNKESVKESENNGANSTSGIEGSPKNLNETYVITETVKQYQVQTCLNDSPMTVRIDFNEKPGTQDSSLSNYFSDSISPTILDGVCQVFEVFDKLGNGSYSDDELDFAPTKSNCLTASTPVLNKKCGFNRLSNQALFSPVAKFDLESPLPEPKYNLKTLKVDDESTIDKSPSKINMTESPQLATKLEPEIKFDALKSPNNDLTTPKSYPSKRHAKFLYPTSSQILRTSRKSPGFNKKVEFDSNLAAISEVSNESTNQTASNETDTQAFDDFPVTQTTLKELSKLMEIAESVHACKSSVSAGGDGYTQFDDVSPEFLSSERSKKIKLYAENNPQTPMIETIKNPVKRLFNSDNSFEIKTASGKDVSALLEGNKTGEPSSSITMAMFEGDSDMYSEPPEVLAEDIKSGSVVRGEDNQGIVETPKFIGFKTGSGKRIEVSDEAVKKAQSLLNIEDVSSTSKEFEQNQNVQTVPKFPGFTTGSGKTIKVSDDALKKAQSLLNVEDDGFGTELISRDSEATTSKECVPPPNPQFVTPKFTGFSTGSGKKIKVSDEALKKAQSLLNIEDDSFDCKASTSKECEPIENFETPKFVGFSTGSGKPIKVSDEALMKAQLLLNAEDDIHETKSISSDSRASTSTECVPPISEFETPKFAGFTTGSGKSIKVSNDAIQKAKLLLKEELTSEDSDPNMTLKFAGFSTGSGKTIPVSNDAILKAKALLTEENFTDSLGFKTPTNFEDASTSKRSKRTLEDENPRPGTSTTTDDHEVPVFIGFTTGSGKKVTVSDEALLKAKSFLLEEPLTSDSGMGASISSSRNNSTIGGFSTASGKKVDISEDSVILAKQKLLDDVSNVMEFKGFCTGTGKKVTVSEEAMNKAKLLLTDQDDDLKTVSEFGTTSKCVVESVVANNNPARFSGFSTGLGKKVTVSDEALSKAKKLMTRVEMDIEPDQSSTAIYNKGGIKPSYPSPATRMFSGKTPKTSEPNMFKKNTPFSTPFRMPRLVKSSNSSKRECPQQNPETTAQPACKKPKISVQSEGEFAKKIIKPGMLFNVKYSGKEPRIKLREFEPEIRSYSREELLQFGIDAKTLDVDSTNSENYRFENVGEGNSVVKAGDDVLVRLNVDGSCGKEEIATGLMSMQSVDSTLISEKWIFNHYRWIIWKLASMEIFFPNKLAGSYLTLDNVLYQLKLRYDREIDKSQRSALKKIFEKDDTPLKTMVLCVSSISTKSGVGSKLELTDGWYKIPALIDTALERMVQNKKIKTGQKLIIHGAELVGSNEAHDPLEAPSDMALKIAANSTRRARWDAKLGFQPNPNPFRIDLNSVLGDGGLVSNISCVIIARIYPIQYLERFPNGQTVARGESAEKKVAMSHEKMRQDYIEEMVSKIQSEIEGKENCDKLNCKTAMKDKTRFSEAKIRTLLTGAELYEAMESYPDFLSFKELLSETQVNLLENYIRERQESKQSRMCLALSKEISKLEESPDFPKARVVVPFLRVRLLNCGKNDEKSSDFSCVLTIWRPDNNLLETLKEGDAYSIFQIVPRSCKNTNTNPNNFKLQLNTTKKTRYLKINNTANCYRHNFVPRMLTPFWKFRSKHFTSSFNEADIVGLLFHIERLGVSNSGGDIRKIYLVDQRSVVIQIILLVNPQIICGEDVLKEGNFIAVTNLKMKSEILVLYATEVTNVTCHPKEMYLREGLNALKRDIQDPKTLINTSKEKLNHTNEPPKTATPTTTRVGLRYPVYSPNCVQMSSSFNNSYNSPFLRPQPKIPHVPNDGLLIKSPIYVEPNSPAEMVSKRTKEKISYLERYGESSGTIDLPCLVSPVSRRVRKPFKVPILNKDTQY